MDHRFTVIGHKVWALSKLFPGIRGNCRIPGFDLSVGKEKGCRKGAVLYLLHEHIISLKQEYEEPE
jgi:hypothetical protein